MDEVESSSPRDLDRAVPEPGESGIDSKGAVSPAETVLTGAGDSEPATAAVNATAAAPTAKLPTHFGRYEVRGLLGCGAFGTVFRAFDPELSRDVAIKVPRREWLNAPGAVDVYLAEAKVLASLDHPGIVPVYDCGRTDDGLCYVVSKFVEGCDLSRLMVDRPLTRESAAKLIATVAQALHYAHKRGLVHCDVKPANILVTPDGDPIVADFGLAVREQNQLRQSGRIAGTPCYMAPEQARGERHRLDGRADIWALGVILYELLTRRRPFEGNTSAQVLDEVVHREAKPPRMVDDTIPPELERIILRCVSKDIPDRYPTAADLSADLKAWLSAAAPSNTAPARREPAYRRPLALWMCAAAAVALCIFVMAQSRKSPTNSPAGNSADGMTPAAPPERPLQSVLGTRHRALEGDVNVRIWSVDKGPRQGLSIHEPGALPLKKDDRIRVEAQLNRPAYVYLVWIGTDGQVSPIYPWRPGDWNQPAKGEHTTGRISLPDEIDTGWPVEGGPGMETVVLLAREEPLAGDLDLKSLLAGLPRQTLQDEHALVWLDQGELSTSRTRAPKFFNPAQLDDPVLKTQKLISQRLKKYFPLIRAVSFANKGGVP